MGDLLLGTVRPDALYSGAQAVSKVYWGAEQVWPSSAPPAYYDFLTVTGTSWTQAGDGEVSVRIGRVIINPPDQQGNTPPTFNVGDYWTLTNESQGGAIVASGPLATVDDTTDPGWIRLYWTTTIPNIGVAGETWRLTPQPAYITEAINLGAVFVTNGSVEVIGGNDLSGAVDAGMSIDGLTAVRGAFGAPATAVVPGGLLNGQTAYTCVTVHYDDPVLHATNVQEPYASHTDVFSTGRTINMQSQTDNGQNQQVQHQQIAGAGSTGRLTVINAADAPGWVISTMAIDGVANNSRTDAYGSTSRGWQVGTDSGAALQSPAGHDLDLNVYLVEDDLARVDAVASVAFFPGILDQASLDLLLDALPTLKGQP